MGEFIYIQNVHPINIDLEDPGLDSLESLSVQAVTSQTFQEAQL